MAPLKFAALALGSLALVLSVIAEAQEQEAKQEAPKGKPNTSDVIQLLNLFRTGRIDVQLPVLNVTSAGVEGKVADFLKKKNTSTSSDKRRFEETRQTTKIECEVDADASTKGLLLEVSDPANPKYGELLDAALQKALPSLQEKARSTASPQEKAEISSIAFLSSETPTYVGCAITTNCQKTYLFCKFAKSATPEDTYLDEQSLVITKPFVQALEARKNANIKIAELQATDANTPLTSGASKVAFSALAVLTVAVPALMF